VLQPRARKETQREEPVALGSLLQQNAAGSLLQQNAKDCNRLQHTAFPGARKCSLLQSVAVYCILLQSVAVCCSVVLQQCKREEMRSEVPVALALAREGQSVAVCCSV